MITNPETSLQTASELLDTPGLNADSKPEANRLDVAMLAPTYSLLWKR